MSADNGGLIDSLKGKAKEVVGSVSGNTDLEEEGRLERKAAATAREGQALERDAAQSEEKAAVEAELAATEVEAERLDAELAARDEAEAAERDRLAAERTIDQRTAAEKAAAEREAASEQTAAGRDERDALQDRAKTQEEIDRLEREADAATATAAVLDTRN